MSANYLGFRRFTIVPNGRTEKQPLIVMVYVVCVVAVYIVYHVNFYYSPSTMSCICAKVQDN